MAGRSHLLVVPVSGASGEMAIGLRLAWQLHAAGDRALFLTPKNHFARLEGTPFPHGSIDGLLGELPGILPMIVAERRADDIILVDLTSALLTCAIYNLDVRFLGRQKVPVLALDLWSLAETSLILDAAGDEIALSRAGLDLVPRRMVVAPYARPDAPGACDFWPARGGTVDRAAARASWADGAERLVVLVTALWQQHALMATPAMAGVPARLAAVLAALPDGLLVVHVGPRPLSGHETLGARYRHVPPLSDAEFRRLLAAADVLVTLNQLPTSAGVALDLEVPVVAVTGRNPRFRVWPGGFNRFFGEVLAQNPFGALVRSVALEDADELRDALWQPRLDRTALAAYRAQIAALPRATDRLDGWLA